MYILSETLDMGNTVALTFLICIFNSVAFGQDFQKDWRLVRNEEDVKTYLHRLSTDITGTVQVNAKKESIDWSKIKKEDFYKSLEEKKKHLLSLIGVTEWTAEKYSWNNANSINELSVIGTYKDSSKHIIQFRELHLFKPNKTIQILYTQPTGVKLNPKTGENFLMSIRKSIGE